LFSVIEHRAWVEQLDHFVSDGGHVPDTSAAVCRFGRWLRAEAKTRYGQRTGLDEIESLHAGVHRLAQTLVEQVHSDDEEHVAATLDQLHGLRDQLHESILRLLQEKAEG